MKTEQPTEALYDVVAVSLDDHTVRILDTGKTLRNAEAVRDMAVLRRGIETEFYAPAPAGKYQEGDEWESMPAPTTPQTNAGPATQGHTPGPWLHVASENMIFSASGNRLVEWRPRSLDVDGSERDSNGRLIAAAPELLAALEQLVKDAAAGEWMNNERLAKARAAIAKATDPR